MESNQEHPALSDWDVECPLQPGVGGRCPLPSGSVGKCPWPSGPVDKCPWVSGPKTEYPKLSNPIILAGMLSGPHIAYCIREHEIIKEVDWNCLDTCTYHMRIGGKVLFWESGERKSFELSQTTDLNAGKRPTFDLKPNSLAFVTTIESFKLTSDIIARFNLKSKYVHMGMLLGTGPIVDPEYCGNLMIPIHNFSDLPITLTYGDQLISVEFTKTLPPDDVVPAGRFFRKYRKNKSSNFKFDDFQKKLENKRVESSVASAFARQSEFIQSAEKRMATMTLAGVAALVFGVIGSFALVVACWDVITSVNQGSISLREQIDREKDAMNEVRAQLKEMHLRLQKIEERTEEAQAKPGEARAN